MLGLNHTMLCSTHCIGQNKIVNGSEVYTHILHPLFLVHKEDKLTY